MIIGACGFGGTGSSAVKDLLKEFNDIQVLDRAESMFAFKVDGMQDLEYHLVKQYSRELSGDVAIKRFLDASRYADVPFVKKLYLDPTKYKNDTIKFINSITQATYYGLENFDYENTSWMNSFVKLFFKKFIIKYYEQLFRKNYEFWPMRKIRISVNPDNFYENARDYMNKIIENAGGDFSKIIVLDQPFEGNNPTQSFPFFEDPYAIVIDRDPRDLYIASSYQWPDGMFMPRKNPENFVQYYRRQRECIKYDEDNRVLENLDKDKDYNVKIVFGKIETMKIVENENGFSIWNNGRQLTNVPFKK